MKKAALVLVLATMVCCALLWALWSQMKPTPPTRDVKTVRPSAPANHSATPSGRSHRAAPRRSALYFARVAGGGVAVAGEPITPVSVFEKDLTTGRVNRITDLRVSKGSRLRMRMSVEGDFLALLELPREDASSDSRSWANPAAGLWLWSRATDETKFIAEFAAFTSLCWSPAGDNLLAFDADSPLPHLAVYDARGGKARTFGFHAVTAAAWSPNGDSIIVADSVDKERTVVYRQPLRGDRTVLFKWRGSISFISAYSGGYAVYADELYITDKSGKKRRRVPIPLDAAEYGSSVDTRLSANGAGSRLAVFMEYNWGEPHINYHQELWIVLPRSGAKWRAATWDETLAGSEPEDASMVARSAEGWSAAGRYVLVLGNVQSGYLGTYRDDRFVLWVYDTVRKKGRKLFDSGPGCPGATWWQE